MAEWTHATNPPQKKAGPRQRLLLISAGTALAILGAGVMLQVFRAESGSADDRATKKEPSSAGVAKVDSSAKHVARVNGELIPYDQLANECITRYGQEVLENLINRTIIQQACETRGIQVTMEEVQQEVLTIAKRFDLPVETWYQMLRAERGLSMEQYHRDVIWPMLALKKLAGQHAEVTEDELARAFQRDYGKRVKARIIMLQDLEQAKKVWTEAKRAPDDFDRLAQEYSVEPNSRALGGAVPPIRRFAGNENLEDAAFRLKKGEISGIIQVNLNQQRYVIVKSEGFTEPVVEKIDEVRDQLYEQLIEEKVQESVAKIFNSVKEGAAIDNYITNTSTRGTERPAASTGKGGTPIGSLPPKNGPVTPAGYRR